MAEIRTPALVLRTFDQSESDRLLHLYTEALGRVSAIAKGGRRSRRRFPGTLEILTLLEARLVDPPRAALMRLEGARVLEPFEGLVNDLGRYAIACELLELLDRLTGEGEANPPLFHFAGGVLDVLRSEAPDRLLGLLVWLKTLARLGYRPQLARCAVCAREIGPGSRGAGFEPRHGGAVCAACREAGAPRVSARLLRALDAGIRMPLRERGQLGLGAGDLRRAEQLLERFFRFHVGLDLRTLAFLRETLPLRALDAPSPRGDTAPTSARGGAHCQTRVRLPSAPEALTRP